MTKGRPAGSARSGPEDFRDFLQEFQAESDRAAAVLGGALLDDRLRLLLQAKLVGSRTAVKELLDRPLHNFAARIAVAAAVGLITQRAASDLHLVRAIRNSFAHKLHGLSFETPAIKAQVGNFKILSVLRDKNGRTEHLPKTPRERFNLAVALLLWLAIEHRHGDVPSFEEPQVEEFILVSRALSDGDGIV